VSTRRLAELIEDFSVYPRHAIDEANVGSLAAAARSGVALPPLVIEAATNRIVDGFHRARVYRRLLGPEGVVEVEEATYGSEDELLLDAVRRNASHGRKLDGIDQVRIVSMCRERGIALAAVAHVLHIPTERAEKLLVRLATAPAASGGMVPGTLSVALKRPVAHLAGKALTEAQAAAHMRAPGVSYLLIANQLAEAIQVGFINPADERLMDALAALEKALAGFLEEQP